MSPASIWVFKTLGEYLLIGCAVAVEDEKNAFVMALIECSGNRVKQPQFVIIADWGNHSVDKKPVVGRCVVFGFNGFGY